MKKQDKFIFLVKVSDKGQISIPKAARDAFGIETGDTLLMLGDLEKGLALVKSDEYYDFASAILSAKGEESDD